MRHDELEFILGMQVWLNIIIIDVIHFPTNKEKKTCDYLDKVFCP